MGKIKSEKATQRMRKNPIGGGGGGGGGGVTTTLSLETALILSLSLSPPLHNTYILVYCITY